MVISRIFRVRELSKRVTKNIDTHWQHSLQINCDAPLTTSKQAKPPQLPPLHGGRMAGRASQSGLSLKGCSVAIALLFLSNFSRAVGQNLSDQGRTTTSSRCEPIGRVLSKGSSHFPQGSLLCPSDYLNVASGKTVDVLCLDNGQLLKVSGSKVDISNKCVQRQLTRVQRSCPLESRGKCRRTKGPGEENTPKLISPYSSMLLDSRPLITWYPFQGATSYIVEVSGEGVVWQKVVNGTTLAYPSEQPAMQFGHAYKITIIANQGEETLSASISVVNMLPENDAQLVLNLIERIEHLNLPQDEAAFLDLNSIYRSKHLITETIKVLSARVAAGSRNPKLYRILGDRYLEAGLPDYAKQQYETASKLAIRVDNPIELSQAQAGLKAVEVALLNEQRR